MDAVLASSTIWEDVLALHICPLLGVADLSALRRTCKALRLLVSERLPDTTWKSVAHNSLPAKHRLLLLPGSEVKGYLERVARAKQNLPEPTSLRLWRGERRTFRSALNHKRTQVVISQGDDLSICELQLDKQPNSLHPIWSQAAVEATDADTDVMFTRSPSDQYVAICYTLLSEDDPRAARGFGGYFDVIYLFDSATQTLHQLACSDELRLYDKAQFGPSEQPILFWADHSSDTVSLALYDCATCKHTAKYQMLCTNIPFYSELCFAPDGRRFATSNVESVFQFNLELESHRMGISRCQANDLRGQKSLCIAFSPDGDWLGNFAIHDASGQAQIHLFKPFSSLSFEPSAGPAWPSVDFAAHKGSELQMSFDSLIIESRQYMQLFSIKPESFGEQLQAVDGVLEMAASPDGVFLAAIVLVDAGVNARRQNALRIYQLATGRLLHACHEQTGRLDTMYSLAGHDGPVTFKLRWASTGLRLFVHCQNDSFYTGDIQMLITFTF